MKLLGFSYMHLSNKKIHLDKKKCCCSCSSSSIFNVRLGENGKKTDFQVLFFAIFLLISLSKTYKSNFKMSIWPYPIFCFKTNEKKIYFVFYHICSCCCCNAATMQLQQATSAPNLMSVASLSGILEGGPLKESHTWSWWLLFYPSYNFCSQRKTIWTQENGKKLSFFMP